MMPQTSSKIERTDVKTALWRKKVDNTFFRYKVTTLPRWIASQWNLEKYFKDNKVDFEASTLTPALGSGPYILDKVDVGKQIIYKKNPNYWGNDLPINKGRYNFDKFRIEYFADYNSAFEGFKAGTYTFRNEASSKIWATGYDFPALEKNWVKKTTLPDGNLSSGQSFVLNLRREKFQDIKVRKAIGLMFNFEWSNSTLFYGLYERINSFWDNSDLKASGMPIEQELVILNKYKDILDANNFSEEVFHSLNRH